MSLDAIHLAFDEYAEGGMNAISVARDLSVRMAMTVQREGLAEQMDARARQFLDSLKRPMPEGDTEHTARLRIVNDRWWRRQLTTAIPRLLDQRQRDRGAVHKDAEIYVSDAALEIWRDQQRANRELLARTKATNEIGQEFSLADLSGRSVSDPLIRRTEMLVRVRGIEEYAKSKGHGARFITLTCPSRFHVVTKGRRNGRYSDGTDPRMAMDYLNAVWARIRAAIGRDGGDCLMGLRVAEPHHDGTPHLHFLVFGGASELDRAELHFRDYGLASDAHEPGAAAVRVVVERIDPERGSATGYVAKYISKSVDGVHLESDLYGKPAESSAERITAWARVWGIRQFSFFGSAAIGPWRELRRRRTAAPPPYEQPRLYADQSRFADYIHEVLATGLTTFRAPWLDPDTGETSPPVNCWGEPIPDPVRGVAVADDLAYPPLYTRLMRWAIETKSEAIIQAVPVELPVPDPMDSIVPDAEGGGPWTCVNNCTQPTYQPQEKPPDAS